MFFIQRIPTHVLWYNLYVLYLGGWGGGGVTLTYTCRPSLDGAHPEVWMSSQLSPTGVNASRLSLTGVTIFSLLNPKPPPTPTFNASKDLLSVAPPGL